MIFELEGDFKSNTENKKRLPRYSHFNIKDRSPTTGTTMVSPTSNSSEDVVHKTDGFSDTTTKTDALGSNKDQLFKLEAEKKVFQKLVQTAYEILTQTNALVKQIPYGVLQERMRNLINSCLQNNVNIYMILDTAEDKYINERKPLLKEIHQSLDSVALHWPKVDESQELIRRPPKPEPPQSEAQERVYTPEENVALDLAAKIYSEYNDLFSHEVMIISEDGSIADYNKLMQEFVDYCKKHNLDVDDIKEKTVRDYKKQTDLKYKFVPKWPAIS